MNKPKFKAAYCFSSLTCSLQRLQTHRLCKKPEALRTLAQSPPVGDSLHNDSTWLQPSPLCFLFFNCGKIHVCKTHHLWHLARSQHRVISVTTCYRDSFVVPEGCPVPGEVLLPPSPWQARMCLPPCGFPSSGCFCKRSHATRGLHDWLLAPTHPCRIGVSASFVSVAQGPPSCGWGQTLPPVHQWADIRVVSASALLWRTLPWTLV